MVKLMLGDCLLKLTGIPDNSVDSIVTDPPYGLSFMGKSWDYDVPAQNIWEECLRVLKPGGHLLAFFGTRTYHRGVCRIEDAGFEIRDQIQWIYGSGFPKSLNLKDEWQGWGTALKPANEPIVVARKPLEKGLTVAQNVLKWGTGALNIDGSRIGTDDTRMKTSKSSFGIINDDSWRAREVIGGSACGRWPANVILDEVAAEVLDGQSGMLKSGAWNGKRNSPKTKNSFGDFDLSDEVGTKASSGGASRFFYVAKASKSERNAGLEGMQSKQVSHMITGSGKPSGSVTERAAEGEPNRFTATHQNFHPTVKPTKLMGYLCTLVTPPGGTVLDPFMGSGSTGVAALREGFSFIGIEREQQYFEICQKRIESFEQGEMEVDPQMEFPS